MLDAEPRPAPTPASISPATRRPSRAREREHERREREQRVARDDGAAAAELVGEAAADVAADQQAERLRRGHELRARPAEPEPLVEQPQRARERAEPVPEREAAEPRDGARAPHEVLDRGAHGRVHRLSARERGERVCGERGRDTSAQQGVTRERPEGSRRSGEARAARGHTFSASLRGLSASSGAVRDAATPSGRCRGAPELPRSIVTCTSCAVLAAASGLPESVIVVSEKGSNSVVIASSTAHSGPTSDLPQGERHSAWIRRCARLSHLHAINNSRKADQHEAAHVERGRRAARRLRRGTSEPAPRTSSRSR